MKVEIKEHELDAVRQLLEYVPTVVAVYKLGDVESGRKMLTWTEMLREFVERVDSDVVQPPPRPEPSKPFRKG